MPEIRTYLHIRVDGRPVARFPIRDAFDLGNAVATPAITTFAEEIDATGTSTTSGGGNTITVDDTHYLVLHAESGEAHVILDDSTLLRLMPGGFLVAGATGWPGQVAWKAPTGQTARVRGLLAGGAAYL